MSLYQKFKSLPPRTRVLIGAGIMAYAGFGLLVTDKAEKVLGMEASEEEKEKLRRAVPRVVVVEKRGDGEGGD
ncbi:MAG: hypothetical protein M1839_000326 [Geoglossum umbratile]|nr:MAG: hypothetical protein M1839_000326 [Geoglossum umbratile]